MNKVTVMIGAAVFACEQLVLVLMVHRNQARVGTIINSVSFIKQAVFTLFIAESVRDFALCTASDNKSCLLVSMFWLLTCSRAFLPHANW